MLRPDRDEREALQLDDIASAVNAGLPLGAILPGTDLSQGLSAALRQQRGLHLNPAEAAMLEAAEVAGTVPASIRLIAGHRRRRAAFARSLARQIRYPLVVLVVAILAAFVSAPIRGQNQSSLLLTLVGLAGVLFLLGWFVRSRVRSPHFQGGPSPLQNLLQDLGEVPYLQSLSGLYGSGVKLQQAHDLAADSVGVPYVRYRLRSAKAGLAKNQPLTESLAAVGALCPETMHLLAVGEAAGELEDAMQRALERRLECLERRLARWATTIGSTIYISAAAYAIYLVFTFYKGLFEGLHGGLLGR